MNRLNHIVLFSATFFGAVMACDGAELNVVQTGTATVSDVDTIALKVQTESILVGFDALSNATAGGNQQLSLDRLTVLRGSIEELSDIAPYSTARQTQPSPGEAKRQTVILPSGPIKASDEPPTEDELADMERAVALTHLPGPPLQDVEEDDSTMPLPIRVHRASLDALALLDEVELAIRNQRLDDAMAAQRQARQIIENLDADIP